MKSTDNGVAAGFTLVEGLEYETGEYVTLSAFPDVVSIYTTFRRKKNPEYTLNYAQIRKIDIIKESQVVEAEKSVFSRAVVGGVLLGGLGATIGAISGIGKKKKNKISNYLVIKYASSGSDEVKTMAFLCPEGSSHPKKFLYEVHARAGLLKDAESSRHEPIKL